MPEILALSISVGYDMWENYPRRLSRPRICSDGASALPEPLICITLLTATGSWKYVLKNYRKAASRGTQPLFLIQAGAVRLRRSSR